ncbi:MAG: TldD/PmbA family protein [Candidatus Aminicenantes bacterium]|nr:TldD/PmbA family protein [Candidatus Aminicenantes bacterium]MDH5706580.1 TldD/PmbA family protein [Candidatus Aminicenantes bacterium]
MKNISRRSFLKTAASAATVSIAAPVVLPRGWVALAGAEKPGYFEREFGITDSLCQKVLAEALSKGGDFADLYFEHTISNSLSLEDGKVNRAYSDVSLGVGIRTVKDDQVGYGFTQEMTVESMLNAASTAATIASAKATKPAGKFEWLKTKNYYPLQKLLTSVPLESKLPLVQTANDKCFALSSQVVKVNAGFYDQQKRILVVTSDGIKAEDLQPRNYLYASVTAEKDGRRERAGWNIGGRRDFSFYTQATVDEIAKMAVDRTLVLFEAVQAPAGEMPVVLGPGVTAVLLHEAIGHGMEADFNRKKLSTYSTMIGRQVAEPFVTIIDDGTMPNYLGSINVDDEGTPGQKTVLVDKGILTSYMYDKISARHYKVKSSGNGRRESYQHYVQPRMRNTIMLAGPATPKDVIQNVTKGIYVQDVSNGQVKIGEGDFAFYVSQGKMIENGKITAPIKDMNIMGNGPKMLQNITMLASDFEMNQGGSGACGKGGQAVPCGFGQPTCLVKSMTVGGVKR